MTEYSKIFTLRLKKHEEEKLNSLMEFSQQSSVTATTKYAIYNFEEREKERRQLTKELKDVRNELAEIKEKISRYQRYQADLFAVVSKKPQEDIAMQMNITEK